ncbi:MAG: gephyrin-like molybdotransferase Glp [Deltaproteobacteria bacterium]
MDPVTAPLPIEFTEARDRILASVAPLGIERVLLLDAAGRTIAEDVVAPRDMPPLDNSAMDGYAVRAADCAAPTTLVVAGYHPAGGPALPRVETGHAVRIMTGAAIPAGCDAVVPLEDTDDLDGRVRIRVAVAPGAHIRRRGEDVPAGRTVVCAGTALRPPEVGMLASFGKAFVPVYRRPRVAVLATGDELVELGDPLAPDSIVNSNSLSLAAALAETGAVPEILGIARDDRESLRGKIAAGLAADALITSAGVSAGDRDLVRDVLAELSVRQLFWKIRMRPGSPTAFGLKDGKPVFSLPGNPVSTLVTFEELVRPALLKMMGRRVPVKPFVKAVLTSPVKKKAGRVQFLRVQVEARNGEYAATPAGDQSTGILTTLLRSDGLAFLPADATVFRAGEEVDVHLLYLRHALP